MTELVHELPDGKPVCGVTSLDAELYVIRAGCCDVEVYDMTSSFSLVRHVTVRGLQRTVLGIPLMGQAQPVDMTSCQRHNCVYIADAHHVVVHRVYMDGAGATQWSVNELPSGLAVTGVVANVLVACNGKTGDGPSIREFTALGCLVREIALRSEMSGLKHCAMLHATRQYVVCWSNPGGATGSAGLGLVDLDGQQIRVCQDTSWKSPCHVVQLGEGGVLVVADSSGRVSLVDSNTLARLTDKMTGLGSSWNCPRKLAWNNRTQQLCIADQGRVKIYNVQLNNLKTAVNFH